MALKQNTRILEENPLNGDCVVTRIDQPEMERIWGLNKQHSPGKSRITIDSNSRTDQEREQYAAWLKKYHWDYFMTVTFRSPRKDPLPTLKHVWHELEDHNVKRAFLGVEPHQSGDLHIHGLLAGAYGSGSTSWRPGIDLPWTIWEGLHKRFGRSKVEACDSNEAVTAYCSKYILKQQSRVADYYEVYGDKIAWDKTNYEERG